MDSGEERRKWRNRDKNSNCTEMTARTEGCGLRKGRGEEHGEMDVGRGWWGLRSPAYVPERMVESTK